jgi:hypothetical protein
MEDAPGDHGSEWPGIIEVLQRNLPVERTFGSMWVDREHVITRSRERRSDAAFVATTDLEHAGRRLGQIQECERREAHDGHRSRGLVSICK